jgi:acylphosphatase
MRKRGFQLIILAACTALLSGCSSHLFMYQVKNGRSNIQSAYNSLDEASDIDTTLTLKNIKVRIIGDRDKFLSRYALDKSVRGYVKINNDDSAEIYLIGYRQKGKIIVNQIVLGHEINHILNHKNNRIADPDTMDVLFK